MLHVVYGMQQQSFNKNWGTKSVRAMWQTSVISSAPKFGESTVPLSTWQFTSPPNSQSPSSSSIHRSASASLPPLSRVRQWSISTVMAKSFYGIMDTHTHDSTIAAPQAFQIHTHAETSSAKSYVRHRHTLYKDQICSWRERNVFTMEKASFTVTYCTLAQAHTHAKWRLLVMFIVLLR